LSYCNRCGAELSTSVAKKKSSEDKDSFAESLVWSIVAVSVGGLALLIGLMALMKNELHFANGMIVIVSILSFVLLLGAEGTLVWLLLNTQRRARSHEKEAVEITQPKGTATKELGEAQQPMLVEPAASVTEHTTRTLEPLYRERKNS
jgi:hypothetical protein